MNNVIKSDFSTRLNAHKLDPDAMFELARRTFQMWLQYSEPKRAVWRMCSAFRAGLQWGVFDRSYARLEFPEPPTGQVNMVVDKIGPWTLDMTAKLTADNPEPEAFPTTNTPDAKDAALAAKRVCSHYWIKQVWEAVWASICSAVLEHGDVFGFEDWSETAGGLVMRQYFTDTGEKDGQPKLEVLGDNITRVYPAFCVATDMLPTPMDDKWWFVIAEWMSCEDIYNEYKVELEPETNVTYKDEHYEQLARLVSGMGSNLARPTMEGVEGATVYKWYQRPQEGVPDGFYSHIANKKQLRGGKWPRQYAKMRGNPLVKYTWNKDLLHFYSQSPVEPQMPLQKQINKTESQLIEAQDTMANLKWLVPYGSGVQSITDLSGDWIQYNSGYKPEQSQPTSMPAYIFRHADSTLLHMEDVQLLHKASRGQNPSGSRSATMLANLQEQDDRPLSVPQKGLHRMLSLQFSKKLQIVAEMVETPRLIQFVGQDNSREVALFKGADLHDQTTITMRVIQGISSSKAANAALILESFQVGGIRNAQGQPDGDKFMELMQFAIPGSQYSAANNHRNMAREENALIWQMSETGQFFTVPVELWERHDLHLDEHEQQMNTTRWKMAAAQDPQFRAVWEQHWIETVQKMAEALGAAAPGSVQSKTQEQGQTQQ